MSIVIVTGAAGLIGSQTVRHFHDLGLDVVGLDNDMRSQFFGSAGSVRTTIDQLRKLPHYLHLDVDVRDPFSLGNIWQRYGRDVSLVVHCAAQPAHDWGMRNRMVDWNINATGTVNVLDVTKRHAPDAVAVCMSTIKVYGQWPNALPLEEQVSRYEVIGRRWNGIGEDMSIDGSEHSLFGASKTAADIMAQEYGHSLDLRTVVLRPGCLTGPAHAAVEMHGFLGHLIRCVASGEVYRVHGDGKQVRDQLHAADVVTAIDQIWRDPPEPGSVFNLGGGRGTDVSVLEALAIAEAATGRPAKTEHVDARHGDHRWWITDTSKFRARYPAWAPTVSTAEIVRETADAL